MTIKEFSKLCNCTTQTLRYYDHVNLLKPAKVDDWTGYRYYSEEQALLYVKIKSFQEADFTIEEIKSLLDKDDGQIYAAFEKKIAAQEEKLNKIRQIQQSYRIEVMNMEKAVEQFVERMNEDARQYNPTEEFGIDKEYYEKLIVRFNDMIHNASYIKETHADAVSEPVFEYSRCQDEDTAEDENRDMEEQDEISPLQNPNYTITAEYHNWNYIKEIIDDFSGLEENTEYNFYLEADDKKGNNLIFCFILIQLAEDKNQGKKLITPSCNMSPSTDGKNHLYILKKKSVQKYNEIIL